MNGWVFCDTISTAARASAPRSKVSSKPAKMLPWIWMWGSGGKKKGEGGGGAENKPEEWERVKGKWRYRRLALSLGQVS